MNRGYGRNIASVLLYLALFLVVFWRGFCRVVFVRSGYINLPGVSGATYRNAGINGYDWSSRGSATRHDGAAIPSGYNLGFNATGVNPSNGPNERWHGFPLRCLSCAAARCRSLKPKEAPAVGTSCSVQGLRYLWLYRNILKCQVCNFAILANKNHSLD